MMDGALRTARHVPARGEPMSRDLPSPAPRALGFGPSGWSRRALSLVDLYVLLGLAAVIYLGARLALGAPASIAGPEIDLSIVALPRLALLSLGRMTAAYALSLVFSLAYGYTAARHLGARKVLLPVLDVLQSVPILSFLPVAVLGLSAVLPARLAAELAAVLLIFTSQAWNMTFSFYQSVSTVPSELREASAVFRLNPWLRFRTLELPFGMVGLIWNSMMSWAGGWFFLMASEMFQVGRRDFRLPGLGSYLQTAAQRSDHVALACGLGTLVGVIVLLDRLIWRPLLAWAERFKIETTEQEAPLLPSRRLLARSRLLRALSRSILRPLALRLDQAFDRLRDRRPGLLTPEPIAAPRSRLRWLWRGAFALALAWATLRAVLMLHAVPAATWGRIGLAVLWTGGRVAIALLVALAWTLPIGILIGSSGRLSRSLQPVVQVLAAVPATALFPILLLGLLRLPHGLEVAAVLLMLMGTQWYLLFNTIAGASTIPVDLRYTAAMLRLGGWQTQRVLVLPALFPFLVTGGVAASGGAWNASVVAEHVEFAGSSHDVPGIGAMIAQATSRGDYALLLAATLALVGTVVLINHFLWQRLYRLAERRYRLD